MKAKDYLAHVVESSLSILLGQIYDYPNKNQETKINIFLSPSIQELNFVVFYAFIQKRKEYEKRLIPSLKNY